MADAANKYSENAPGKYYVDNQCIDCDLCRETAPANFKRNDDGGGKREDEHFVMPHGFTVSGCGAGAGAAGAYLPSPS